MSEPGAKGALRTYRYLITFYSTHYVMAAEGILASNVDPGEFRTVPTPRKISSECGFSIAARVSPERYHLEGVEGIYSIHTTNTKELAYEKIS
ncbi:MAG: DUF3343 domain-containing protein [Spirochaetota bacterium]